MHSVIFARKNTNRVYILTHYVMLPRVALTFTKTVVCVCWLPYLQNYITGNIPYGTGKLPIPVMSDARTGIVRPFILRLF
jgi:hypothetical protein